MVTILRSLSRVKGVNLSIKAEFWGLEYAADSEKPSYEGKVDRWASGNKDSLYIMNV